MLLSNLIEDTPDIEIEGVYLDSRLCTKNSIFACIEGRVNDGHSYIDEAISKGAICIIHKKDITNKKDKVCYVQVGSPNKLVNDVLNKFYDKPSSKLKVFGVTGTNGKTIVSRIIKNVVSQIESCGYIGSVETEYNQELITHHLKTPDAYTVQTTIKDMYESKVNAISMEVSSDALEDLVVDAVDFDVVVYTNFSKETLDYQGTLDNYFYTKSKLLYLLNPKGVLVLNADDKLCTDLISKTNNRIVTYSVNNNSDYQATNINIMSNKTTFELKLNDKVYTIKSKLLGMSNVYNLLASIASLVESNYDIDDVIKYINCINNVDGRYQYIDKGQPFKIYVDFARTIEGFTLVHEFAKTITPEGKRIISVFGANGRKDKSRRQHYGEVVDKYSSLAILTEDDPKDESVKDIITDIKKGITTISSIFIEDRYDAIRQAIELANPNDTILILGKGDDTFLSKQVSDEMWMGDSNVVIDILDNYYFANSEEN